jgi:carbon storage regulator
MLVLSRQRDETIMIGDDIEITIVDIRGDKVRLGITAPNTIPVHRKEVYEAIQRENREAAKVRAEDLPNLPTRPGVPGAGRGPGAVRPPRNNIPVTRPGGPDRPAAPPPADPSATGDEGPRNPPDPANGA